MVTPHIPDAPDDELIEELARLREIMQLQTQTMLVRARRDARLAQQWSLGDLPPWALALLSVLSGMVCLLAGCLLEVLSRHS